MAAPTKEDILEAIASMSVLEVSELVKAMEEKFGVTAAAPVAVAAVGAVAADGDGEDEQTEFNVILVGFDDGKKIPVIKEVRAITGLGLKEAKELVEAGGKAVKEGVSKDESASLKEKLGAAGAKVEVKSAIANAIANSQFLLTIRDGMIIPGPSGVCIYGTKVTVLSWTALEEMHA
ncbi:MAG: 50S ribosomal protein L7/L12 [Lysobacterales bacterium]|nr:MAG: 50S ribosomal protein L7/L12 [Xanthomonadales bacterium]